MGSAINFHGVGVSALEALRPGSRVLLDAGISGEVTEHLHRSRQLRVLPDGQAGRHLVVTYDAIEEILSGQ